MTDSIKIKNPVLSQKILLEINQNEIGSHKINNLSKKFEETDMPENGKPGQGEGSAVTLTQMMMGML
jgi:hypothetical protein